MGQKEGAQLIKGPNADQELVTGNDSARMPPFGGAIEQVVHTLLELLHLAPHPSLHGGRVTVSLSTECMHASSPASLLLGSCSGGGGTYQVCRQVLPWRVAVCIPFVHSALNLPQLQHSSFEWFSNQAA